MCDFAHIADCIAVELRVIAVLDFHHRDKVGPLKGVSVRCLLHQDSVRLVRPGPMARHDVGTTQGEDKGGASVAPLPCILTEHFNHVEALNLDDHLINGDTSLWDAHEYQVKLQNWIL